MNLPLSAKIIEFKILSRMANIEDAILWADQEILKSECPSVELCDISISTDEEEVLKILEALGESKDLENQAFEYIGAILSKQYRDKALNFFDVVNKLLVMHYHSSALSSKNVDFCIWLDDEACLIADGVKDLEPAQEALSEFLYKLEGSLA